ncbi:MULTISPECIES: ATP-binding protein [Thalassospira]|uniref:AAA family ATPase n=1 Tax=Thalassospira TaxID=168934 RepID=UPI000C40DED2|nr:MULTISPECIES: ATP-binding protein [Thalassospira]MAB32258.1 DNA transposition protein [Thalassospira sp.]HBS22676.1 ATP-binding protein [Thalassospira sp.]|tara:strand:- start:70 stop:834 length:765 start_codon:yes stop_codon:yes gene_type:complete
MRLKFVNTQNVKKLMAGMAAIEQRGAGEACLVVVDGSPGLGKTENISYMAAQNASVFVRAKREWTPNWMLGELLEACGVQAKPQSFERKYRLLVETLSMQAKTAADNGEMFFVGIDECDYICRSDKMLSTIRDLSDFVEIPFVLVGMGKVRDSLTRFPQVTSRVGQYVRFEKLTPEDTEKVVRELCEVKVKDDLIALLHEKANGYIREVKEGIAHIERFGKMQDSTEIGVAEMNGQVLLNDRATSRPIIVRGGK